MNRRDFLLRSSLVIPSMALTGLFSRKAWASNNIAQTFSIDMVTAHPDQAIKQIEQVIKNTALKDQTVKFTEYQLHGTHTSDIAYVKAQQLINFHKTNDKVSNQLRQVAAELSLPKTVENPVVLRFYSDHQNITPTDVHVFSGDVLIKQLPLAQVHDGHRIQGSRGHVDIAIENQTARIISASCKHKTCMTMGAISRPGQNLVCIPNQITVVIAGESTLGIDSLTF